MSGANVELAEGESLMAVADELVYRQITAHMIDRGRIATHAFTGSTSDAGKPSYARASKVGAQESRDWHTANAKSPSQGVWALSTLEVVAAGSRIIDDSASELAPGQVRSPGHCYVDARVQDRLALKALRAELWQAAMARGEIPTREPLQDGELDLGL